MVYINQVMKETLRINGPVVGVVPRLVTEDIVLSGTVIPKGSPITIDIFNIQHSEKVWKNANVFNPGRFTTKDEGGEDLAGWIPFGNGARQCIGMNFSLAEQRVMLSMLLRKFDWKLPQNSMHANQVVPKTAAFIIGPKDLHVEFKKRY